MGKRENVSCLSLNKRPFHSAFVASRSAEFEFRHPITGMWCRTNCWFGPSCFQEGSSHWDVRLEPELCLEPSFWLRPQVVQRPAPGSFDLLVIVFLRNQTQSAITQPIPLSFLSSCFWRMEAGWENQHLKTVFHCRTTNHRFTLCTLFFAPRPFNDSSFLFCTADKNLTQK